MSQSAIIYAYIKNLGQTSFYSVTEALIVDWDDLVHRTKHKSQYDEILRLENTV